MNMLTALPFNPSVFEIPIGKGLPFKTHPLKSVLKIFTDLTGLNNVDMIAPLSVGKLSGIATPFRGQKMTAPFAVFFRLSFRAALVRFYSVMVGLFGLPSGRPLLEAVVADHSNPPPKSLQPLSGGLTTFSRFKPMKTQSTRAKSAQSHTQEPTALFSVFWHRQLIASGLPGSVALRLKAFYPACIVKFTGMGV